MRLLISIGIGLLFLILGQLYLNDFFHVGKVNFLGVKDLGTANFSWIQNSVQKFLYLPNLINSYIGDYVRHSIDGFIITDRYQIFLAINFIFYTLFSYITIVLSSFFYFKKDKRNVILLIMLFYLIFLFFI